MKYDLVFEGGGAKGMAFVGAVAELLGAGHAHDRLLATWCGYTESPGAPELREAIAPVGERVVQAALADPAMKAKLADLGGVTIAFEALQRELAKDPSKRKTIDGFTPEQRFFLSWDRIWRDLMRPEEQRRRVNIDPHSPGRWRVNGPLAGIAAAPSRSRWRQEACHSLAVTSQPLAQSPSALSMMSCGQASVVQSACVPRSRGNFSGFMQSW